MKIEQHKEAYKEHNLNIERAIEEGIENNQRNLGFNISQGSIELFAIFLHKLNLIQSSGDQLDHRIFKSQNLTNKKLPPEFPSRKRVLELMKEIEEERNSLCYGSRKPKDRIEKLIKNFNSLKKIINEELKNANKK
jgi:hypothetical protein